MNMHIYTIDELYSMRARTSSKMTDPKKAHAELLHLQDVFAPEATMGELLESWLNLIESIDDELESRGVQQ